MAMTQVNYFISYLYPHFSIISSARTNLLLITHMNINPSFWSSSTPISSINLSFNWSYIKETPREGAWPANCQGGSMRMASKKPPWGELELVCSVEMKDLKLKTRTSALIGLEPVGGSGFKQSKTARYNDNVNYGWMDVPTQWHVILDGTLFFLVFTATVSASACFSLSSEL